MLNLLLIVLSLSLLLLLAAGLFFALQVVHPKRYSVEETYRTEIETGRMTEAEWLAWEKQEVFIRSPHGYDLFGLYLPFPGAEKTVVIAHGITYTLFGSVKYVNLFRSRGFNILLYDQRNHGRSGGRWSTFGYYEKDDLAAWLAWAREKLPVGGQLGLMGESFGAATALQCVAETPGVAFLVCDCSFSDLTDLLTYHLALDYHLPAFPILNIASLWSKTLTGVAFSDISPLREVGKIELPILFTHGAADQFTPARMSQALYAAKTRGLRALYLAPGADHAQAFFSDPAAYAAHLGAFLAAVADPASAPQTTQHDVYTHPSP